MPRISISERGTARRNDGKRAGSARNVLVIGSEKMSAWVAKAAGAGAQLVLFQELSLTGFLAQTAVIHKIAAEIMVEEINGRNGFLGRPVEYVLLDDQSKPDVARSLYEKLLTVDKVDLIQGPYATAPILAAMGVAQRFGKVIRLFAPLYLSNECINNCAYCGFSRDNAILRVTLGVEEVLREARDHGHRQRRWARRARSAWPSAWSATMMVRNASSE